MTTSSSQFRLCRRFATVAVFTALALAAPSAHAQSAPGASPSAADLESARELYKEGKVLRDKGDLQGALERFKAAHAYGQTPVTALELGRTHMQLQQLVEAREVLLSVGRMKVQPDETEKSSAARTEAAELAEQIRPKIPTLQVKIAGVPEGTPASVTVDGAAVPVVSMGAVRKANPGPHEVVVRAGAREEKLHVELKEGETNEVSISLGGEGKKTASAEGPSAEPSKTLGLHPVTWAGLGVALVGVGVGTVTGILALGKASTVKDECHGTSCPPSAKSDVDSGRTVATISTLGFVAGAAGVAAAAVGYFVLSPRASSTSAVRVQPALSASWAGVTGSF